MSRPYCTKLLWEVTANDGLRWCYGSSFTRVHCELTDIYTGLQLWQFDSKVSEIIIYESNMDAV